jgi:hypothetical protein
MRAVRQHEIENWDVLAKRHGFGAAEGRFTLGRFIVEHRDNSGFLLCAITPIPARLNASGTPAGPVMFDRTLGGEIVVPGRWWHVMFEEVSTDRTAPAAMRHMAARIAATTACHDVLLPADSDTVEIAIQDSRGHLMTYEAVPPGTRMIAKIEPLPITSPLAGPPSLGRRGRGSRSTVRRAEVRVAPTAGSVCAAITHWLMIKEPPNGRVESAEVECFSRHWAGSAPLGRRFRRHARLRREALSSEVLSAPAATECLPQSDPPRFETQRSPIGGSPPVPDGKGCAQETPGSSPMADARVP